MSRPRALSIAVSICAVLALGCSSESSTPSAVERTAIGGTAQFAKTAAGVYQLSFFNTSFQPVETLPVCGASYCDELVLGAHVESQTGAPAQSGSVTFQYCSYKRRPPNDVTRADEAPSSACADGSATWANLLGVSVDASGNASMTFGIVRIPRTIGFRFKYAGHSSGIASGVSQPRDFTWF